MLPQACGAERQDEKAQGAASTGARARTCSACPSSQHGRLNVDALGLFGNGVYNVKMAERSDCSRMACPMQSGSLQGPSVKGVGRWGDWACAAAVRAAEMLKSLKFQLASVTED